jgi:hypothetical protein
MNSSSVPIFVCSTAALGRFSGSFANLTAQEGMIPHDRQNGKKKGFW